MKYLFWIALLGMTLTACASDAAEKAAEAKNQLLGKWELESAERGGKKTDSLRGLYFEFGADGSIVTNILGSEEAGAYEMKEGVIEQRSPRMEVNYQVESLGDSTLVLITNLRNTDFKFVLSRAVEQIEE